MNKWQAAVIFLTGVVVGEFARDYQLLRRVLRLSNAKKEREKETKEANAE